MFIQHFFYSLSIAFGSWLVGMILNGFLAKTESYHNLINLNFIKSRRLNKAIGLGAFKWIVKNTFFKFFNQNLKVKGKVEMADLEQLKKEMTSSEISHLIAFGLVSVFALVKSIHGQHLFGSTIMLVNIFLNLYPSLLQQENKRRINRLQRAAPRYI